MIVDTLNQLSHAEAQELFRDCCAADTWVRGMTAGRPYKDAEAVHQAARELWPQLSEADWLAAFEAHPKIGDVSSLKAKYAHTAAMAGGEQAGASSAPEAVLQCLQDANERYVEKFGFIFIVCATGKSAEEMLALLEARLPNSRPEEISVAAAEQAKISHLRLDKLL